MENSNKTTDLLILIETLFRQKFEVKSLLKKEAKNKDYNNYIKIVKFLIEKTQEELDDQLLEASLKEKLDIVKELVEKGANIEAKDNDNYTSLQGASRNGHLDIVKLLVE